MKKILAPVFLCVSIFISCNDGAVIDQGQAKKDSIKTAKPIPDKKEDLYKKPPIINIVDTLSIKRMVVCFRDSASSQERIGIKLAQLYGLKLADCFKKNAIKSVGPPMAWFHSGKAPYFFEAGIPVNIKPAKLPPGAFVKELAADSVLIAHFYGPYHLISVGYGALEEWLKDHKKIALGAPFEIYISDPIDKNGKPIDPYRVQTDIVFPRK